VSQVARQRGINASQLFGWRRQALGQIWQGGRFTVRPAKAALRSWVTRPKA